MSDVKIRVLTRMADVPAEDWDACAAGKAGEPEPFLRHAFLNALEEAGCATARSGWQPQHLVLEAPDGTIRAVAPAYLKSHSRGEYVFDQGWAEAYHRAGGAYYPKLQVAVPFTPVTGRRLLVRAGDGRVEAEALLAAGLVQLARQRDASSVHVTFPTEGEWSHLRELGFLQRIDQQFHWLNADYASYDDFLAVLASRKRKALKRERREALGEGITIEWLTGTAITERAWDAFYAFYMDTGARKWGQPYLNRTFFSLLGERMADKVLLVMAKRDGRYIAGALNMLGCDRIYGRYWGALEHHPFLHFEVCYHQAIDYAIAHKLAVVEAGAQGEHKLARGYLPKLTYSAHWIADAGFRQAVASYLVRERAHVLEIRDDLDDLGPFRRGSAPEEQD